MFNKTEADERAYLREIIEKLEAACQAVNENVNRTSKELQDQKNYLYENKTGMDAAEKAAVKQSVNMQAISGEAAVAYKKRLLKLMETPYFGRIDFREKGRDTAESVYVGIHSFFDDEQNENLIHDWLKRERFAAEDILIRHKVVPARYLRARYNANNNLPLMKRHRAIATDVLRKIKREFRYDLKSEEKKAIRKQVKNMMGSTNLRVMYEEFFDWMERPDMFTYAKGKIYEYADLFPLMYLKILLEGADFPNEFHPVPRQNRWNVMAGNRKLFRLNIRPPRKRRFWTW